MSFFLYLSGSGAGALSLTLARSAGGGKKRRDLPSFRRGGEMEVSGVGG